MTLTKPLKLTEPPAPPRPPTLHILTSPSSNGGSDELRRNNDPASAVAEERRRLLVSGVMMWYSLLPEELTGIEAWLIRFFVLLGTLTIGPWVFLIVYDILLYIWRAATYEIPIIGGRARGRRRPVAPSLSERPGGRRRAFSLTWTECSGLDRDESEGSRDMVTMGGMATGVEDAGGIKGRAPSAKAADSTVVDDGDDRVRV